MRTREVARLDRLVEWARQYPLAGALILGGIAMIIIAVVWTLIAQPF